AANLHRYAGIDQVDVGVGDGDAPGEEMKLELADLVQVAGRAVGDRADAAERAVDVALHVSPERADPGRIVQVLDDHDPGGGDLFQAPPRGGAPRGRLGRRLLARPDGRRKRVPHHRAELR